MRKSLIVVESPTKAKTLFKFLGSDYEIIATYGHIVDLPSKAEAVDVDNEFDLKYETLPKAKSQVEEIRKRAEFADVIYLATDPDREGEAIAWHVSNQLSESSKTKVKRIKFHEISKGAIKSAIESPDLLNNNLINAQITRRTLDHLMGIRLSRVLWRKIPKSQSAGRVQSAVLRIMCEREDEVLSFNPVKFWNITVEYSIDGKDCKVSARLFRSSSNEVQDEKILSHELVEKIAKDLATCKSIDYSVDVRRRLREPQPPFCTSTLQQAAAQMLGMSPQKTMMLAQKLYEGISMEGDKQQGLITYIRTDSVSLSKTCVSDSRDYLNKVFGNDFVSREIRQFHTKVKNAQEAHEAIRPLDPNLTPGKMKDYLKQDEWRLYKLIWSRTLATQAIPAEYETKKLVVEHRNCNTGATYFTKKEVESLIVDGFLRIYEDEEKGTETPKEEILFLKNIQNGECSIKMKKDPIIQEKKTLPPPRYSQSAIIKQMEKLGIGRPSTYGTTLSVLDSRGYVKIKDKQMIPTPVGYVVNMFLTKFFGTYTESSFTANMEDELDAISRGEGNRLETLNRFWEGFRQTLDETDNIKQGIVLDQLREQLDPYVNLLIKARSAEGGEKSKITNQCPKCSNNLSIRFGRFGVFFGCNGYPDCKTAIPVDQLAIGGVNIGGIVGSESGTGVTTIKVGRYGPYIDQGDPNKKKISVAEKILPNIESEHLKLISSLPLEIGKIVSHPIKLNFARSGFIVECGPIVATVPLNLWPKSIEDCNLIPAMQLLCNNSVVYIERDGKKLRAKIINDGKTVMIGGKATQIGQSLDQLVSNWLEGKELFV